MHVREFIATIMQGRRHPIKPSKDLLDLERELHKTIPNLLNHSPNVQKSDQDSSAQTTLTASQTTIIQALSLLARYLRMTPEQFLSSGKYFFPNWTNSLSEHSEESHFLCYRHDVRAGTVAKSFIVFHSPTETAPFCRFRAFSKDAPRRNRMSSGIVFPFEHSIALLGEVSQGAALKVIALRRPTVPQDQYEGLIMTYGTHQQLLTSRTVLVRTQHKHSDDAGVGTFNVADIPEEIAPLKYDLRNWMEFSLEKTIYRGGKPIMQKGIVQLIYDLLQKDDGYLLQDEDGVPFNPADTDHYTFNVAITLRGANEPTED